VTALAPFNRRPNRDVKDFDGLTEEHVEGDRMYALLSHYGIYFPNTLVPKQLKPVTLAWIQRLDTLKNLRKLSKYSFEATVEKRLSERQLFYQRSVVRTK
jgi:hypothetical protein